MQDVLSEVCRPWLERWDEYAELACWMKRTMPDPSLPKIMSLFQILFGRSPCTPVDALVLQVDDGEEVLGLENSVERQRQRAQQVQAALVKRHADQEAARQSANVAMSRASKGAEAEVGDLVMVKEMESTLHRDGIHQKLAHEKWTGLDHGS